METRVYKTVVQRGPNFNGRNHRTALNGVQKYGERRLRSFADGVSVVADKGLLSMPSSRSLTTTAGQLWWVVIQDHALFPCQFAAMTIHNLYIFSRTGTLLYYTEWNRLNKSGITKEEEAKLMYGMLFSIKSFVNKISPLDPKEGFLYYKTSKYTLHYLETPSGLKFVLNTDNSAPNTRELLQQLYSQVYLEYVVKNPICQLNEPIQSEIFKLKVDELIKKSPIFLNRSL